MARESFTATRSSSKSSVEMIRARADQRADFKNCCMQTGRYDGMPRAHYFQKVVYERTAFYGRGGFELRQSGGGAVFHERRPGLGQSAPSPKSESLEANASPSPLFAVSAGSVASCGPRHAQLGLM